MSALTEWVRQLVVLVFVVSAAQLLLPTDKMRPYVRFVLGLVIVSALISSLFDLTSSDFDLDGLFGTGSQPDSEQVLIERGHDMAVAARARLDEYVLDADGGGDQSQ